MNRDRADRARTAILSVLAEMEGPAGAERIAQAVRGRGVDLRARSVRYHLAALDRADLTRLVSRRRGRTLTARGREELDRSDVMEKLGFVSSRVDEFGYRMTFDVRTGRGTMVSNVAWLAPADLPRALDLMEPAFRAGLGMGDLIVIAGEGEWLGGRRVPPGRVAIGTVCSVTLSGILLKAGIPVSARFGGLIEMRDLRPVRFVQVVEYRGTTIDPLDVFMRAGMTQVTACVRTGAGLVGASFREAPSAAVPAILRLDRAMRRRGFPALLAIGRPDQPLLDIPVADGRTGLLVIGGLNPVATLCEAGIPVELHSLAGLEPFERFRPIASWR